MTKIVFKKQDSNESITVQANPGESILDVALRNNLEIEHACEMSCACTTCHIVVTKGFDSLEEASEREEDLLDKAWGLTPKSRLGCQAIVAEEDLEVEVPKYTVNQVSERH